MLFVSWLAQSLSPPSVVVYLASVRSLHIDQDFPDPTFHTPRLRRVLQGIRRSASQSRPSCWPITRPILQAIHDILAHAIPATDALMFWAACCVVFLGFLRVSEFTPPGICRSLTFIFFMVHLRLRCASASNLPKRTNYGKVVSFTLVVPVILLYLRRRCPSSLRQSSWFLSRTVISVADWKSVDARSG